MATPETPQGKYTDIGRGLKVHYIEYGSGFPVVFLHGSGPGASSLSNFRNNYRVIADAGYRSILMDAIGYGLSSKPPDHFYHLNSLTNSLAAFLDRMEINQCAIVGNSLGGAMGLRLALDRPDLVSALVALAPGGLADFTTYLAMPGIQGLMRVGTMDNPQLEDLRQLFSLQLYDPSTISEDILRERLVVAKTQPKTVFTTLRSPNMTNELNLIKCPVLAFWGQNDNFCPVSTHSVLLEKIDRVRLVQFSHCGHWVQVEFPDIFNRETIAFLKAEIRS